MKHFTKTRGTLEFKHGAPKECFEHFKDRTEYVISNYCKLLHGKCIYSHITGLSHPKYLEKNDELHVHFVKTNEVYDSIFESEQYNKIEILEQVKIPKAATHVVYLDLFGRVLAVEKLAEDLPNFNHLFYGIDDNIQYTEHLWFNNHHRILLPIGNLISGRNLLNTDSLGFRLAETNRLIWDSKNESDDYHDIGIVGGSFGHSQYSLPGESFSELLENLLNSHDISKTKNFRVWNLSMPGHVQADSFSLLMNTSLIKNFNTLLWIDGVNDLFTTTSFDAIGLPNIPLPLPAKWNGVPFDTNLRFTINDGDRINLFVSYRKYICEIMSNLSIKCINILQPTIDIKNSYHKPDVNMLFPFYSKLAWGSSHKIYNKSIPYIQQLGILDNLEFHSYKDDCENPLEFWDFVHLSPRGEAQYAEYLEELVVKSLMQ